MLSEVPVVLFAFDRPALTHRVLASLRAQTVRPSTIIAFADGPRRAADCAGVDATRAAIQEADWADIQLIARERNVGCSENIVAGLGQVFNEYSAAVILEDDILAAPHLFEALTLMLRHYAAEDRVFSVGGHPSLQVGSLPGYELDAIVSPRFSCWGWATWANRGQRLAGAIENFRCPFDRIENVPSIAGDDAALYVRPLLEQTGLAAGAPAAPIWDMRVHLLCLAQELRHVQTRHYLVNNIGVDGTGLHPIPASQRRYLRRHTAIDDRLPERLPTPIDLRPEVCAAIREYVNTFNGLGPTISERLARRFRREIARLRHSLNQRSAQ
ncbi:MAG: glycosyltransferase [Chloroflexi bacterium]|nr:glycosyltransferase [Chloroflexota bacterium]